MAHVGIPVRESQAANRQFQGQHDDPLEYVVPAHGEAPAGIDEASRVGVEASGDGIHDGEFAQCVDDVEHHDADDQEVDQKCAGALQTSERNTRTGREGLSYTLGQGTARADEEASTDRSAWSPASAEPVGEEAGEEGTVSPMAIMWRWRDFMLRSSSMIPRP